MCLPILQLPKDGAGLAVPLASQLQKVLDWGTMDGHKPIQAMLLSRSNKSHLLAKLEADGFRNGCNFPTLLMVARVWDEMCKILGYVSIFRFHPIWERGRLGELGKLQGFTGSCNRDIFFFFWLYSKDHLKSFQDEFGIPHSGFFQYLQLRHALSI